MGSQKKNVRLSDGKAKARWPSKHHKVWVEICLELVKAGRKPGSCIDKKGYEYLVKEFNKRTGLSYSRQQLKNHWDRTKGEWGRWKKLVGSTGLGWDPEKRTIVADNEWWANWLQQYPKDEKWRDEGLEFAEELDVIFGATIATSDIVMAPSSETLPTSTADRVQPSPSTTNIQDDDSPDFIPETQAQLKMPPVGAEIDEDEVVYQSSSRRSRRKPEIGVEPTSQRQKLSNAARLGKQLDRLLDAVESRSTATSQRYAESATIKECIELLNSMPEVPRGSKLYLFAVDTFLNKECREAFIALELPEVRLLWLEYRMEQLASSGRQ